MLSEEQIARYARQILLPEVGGEGQERLLSFRVQLRGQGSALSVAAAYLAAGGMGVEASPRPVAESEVGFLLEHSDVGQDVSGALSQALGDANPDNTLPRTRGATLVQLPAPLDGALPCVVIGAQGGEGVVLFCSEAGCRHCFELTVAGLQPIPSGLDAEPGSVLLGSVAAFAIQRLALGNADGLHAWRVDGEGGIGALEVRRCPS